jgi:hypothetical protein
MTTFGRSTCRAFATSSVIHFHSSPLFIPDSFIKAFSLSTKHHTVASISTARWFRGYSCKLPAEDLPPSQAGKSKSLFPNFRVYRAVVRSRQFSAYKMGVLNDKNKAYEITGRAWSCYVMEYCFMQTHDCRIKLDEVGELLSISESCDLCCIHIT